MSSFGETNVNNYNLDSMDNAHDTREMFVSKWRDRAISEVGYMHFRKRPLFSEKIWVYRLF